MTQKIAIRLHIEGLTLKLKYTTLLYSGSTDLYIQFIMDAYWRGLADKVVVFQVDKEEYNSNIESDGTYYYCRIPAEVLAKPGHIRVGVKGGNTITTNMLPLDVYQGAVIEDEPPEVEPIDLEEMCRERAMTFFEEPVYLTIDEGEL